MMTVPPDATGLDVFPHDEYHYYLINQAEDDEPIHVHVPESVIEDARSLIDHDFPHDTTEWLSRFDYHFDDGTYFRFRPDDPSYSEIRYTKPMIDDHYRLYGASFSEPVIIGQMFIHYSTGPPADHEQHHYKNFRENVVLPEHREQYMNELIEDEQNAGWDTDWIDR